MSQSTDAAEPAPSTAARPDTGDRPAPITTGRPPELIGIADGVSLRRRRSSDAPGLNAAVRESLDHLRPWMPWADRAPGLDETADLARRGEQAWDDGTDFMYLVGADAEPGGVIGAFGLHGRIGPGALEIGYWIHPAHVGKGLATSAARVLTEAALALPGIERVEIHCDAANAASAAVPRKLGYRLARTEDSAITAPSETGRKLVWITEKHHKGRGALSISGSAAGREIGRG